MDVAAVMPGKGVWGGEEGKEGKKGEEGEEGEEGAGITSGASD